MFINSLHYESNNAVIIFYETQEKSLFTITVRKKHQDDVCQSKQNNTADCWSYFSLAKNTGNWIKNWEIENESKD